MAAVSVCTLSQSQQTVDTDFRQTDMEFKRNIMKTGGAGFIGSHVVRLFVNKYPEYCIINLDKVKVSRQPSVDGQRDEW